MRCPIVAAVLWCSMHLCASSNGQEVKRLAADARPKINVDVRFTDGGSMRMGISEEFVELGTTHGKLRIAASNIRRIEMATRITESTKKLIDQSIADLGNANFRAREKATAELLGLREKGYPALIVAARSTDAEVSKRAKELLERIRARVPANRLKFRERDLVYTMDSTITGRLEISEFQATTQQFGPVQLKIADVASMHFYSNSPEIDITLDGRFAINNEAWLDTGLDVTEHTNLTILASGEIDMYATDGYIGQYVGTPKGKKAWPGNPGGPYEPGTLIGRVGESGKVFVIKDQFDDFAPASGRLYLRAAGNPYNVKTSGQYSIKVQGGMPTPGGPAHNDAAPAAPNPAAEMDKDVPKGNKGVNPVSPAPTPER